MRKNKLKFKIIALLLAIVTLTAALPDNATYAWFGGQISKVNMDKASGELLTQYFHCGKGTEDDPFVITRPVHYYNLVQLYQRVKDYSDKQYYFQVGYNNFNPADPDGFYVYQYDDDGNPVINDDGTYNYTKTLNLSYYDGDNPLLPIGTHDRNFRGYFDGKGITIKGFTVSGDRTVVQAGDVCDIGIFGFVGGTATIANTYFEDVTIDLGNLTNVVSSVTSPQTHNEDAHYRDGYTVSYAGYLAGHIVQPNNITDVYINDVTLVGGDVATNDFGYYGCVENEDGTVVQTLGESIGEQFGSGDENGWGGTVDMKQLFNRLYKIADIAYDAGAPSYPSEETVVMEDGHLVSRVVNKTSTSTSTSTSGTGSYSVQFRGYHSDVAGSYYFNTANGYDPYIYLTGLNEFQTKTVTTYQVTEDSTKTAYYICDDNAKNYMGITTTPAVTNTTSTSAAKWTFEKTEATDSETGDTWIKDSKIYTLVGKTMYYLNRSGNTITLDTTATTTWTYYKPVKGRATIYTTEGSGDSMVYYYLTFIDAWQLSTDRTTYNISDGYGHYLSTDGTELTTETEAGKATAWEVDIPEPDDGTIAFKTKIKKTSGSTITYEYAYLSFVDGVGLTLNTSSSDSFFWTKKIANVQKDEDMSLSYEQKVSTDETRTWYITYDDGWKVVVLQGTNIYCTTPETATSSTAHYLTANRDKDGITEGFAMDYVSLWQLDTAADSTTISLVYNGNVYYVGANTETGKLTLSDTATTWRKDTELTSGNYYYILVGDTEGVGGVRYYLTYNNGWIVEANTQHHIYYKGSDSKKHYMSVDLDASSGLGEATALNDQYTNWHMSDDTAGKIYAVVDNAYYYLCCENRALILRTPTSAYVDDEGKAHPAWTSDMATSWLIDSSGRRYVEVDGNTLYISYDTANANNRWVLESLYYTYESPINSSPAHYLTMKDDGSGITTASDYSSQLSKWEIFDDPSDKTSTNKKYKVWVVGPNSKKRYYLVPQGENKAPTVKCETDYSGTESPYIWTKDGDTLKTTMDSVEYVLVYKDDNWITLRSGTKLIANKSGDTFMCVTKDASNNVILSETTDSNATNARWILSNSSSTAGTQTTFSILYNDTRYYVRTSATDVSTLCLTTDSAEAITWTYSLVDSDTSTGVNAYAYCYYPNGLSTPFYLLYDGGFTVRPTSWYNIKNSTSENYLIRKYDASKGTITYTNQSKTVPTLTGNFHATSTTGPTTDIYYYEPSTDGTHEGGKAYYLGWNGAKLTYTLVPDASSAITWNRDTTNGGYYIDSNKYLMYDSANYNYWTCRPISGYHRIYVKVGDTTFYLGINTKDTIINRSTRWTFSNPSNRSGTLSAYVNGKTYYLNNVGGELTLSTSDNGTTWSYDGTTYKTLTCKDPNNTAGASYYLIYDPDAAVSEGTGSAGWKLAMARVSISNEDKDKYLVVSSGAISTGASNTANWNYVDNKLSTYVDGTRYYLYHNTANNKLALASGTGATTTASTVWKYDSTTTAYYFEESNGVKNYLLYDSDDTCQVSGWVCKPVTTYCIVSNSDNHYLGITNTTSGNIISNDSNTRWSFTGTATDPGNISSYAGGQTSYLCATSGKLTLSSTADTRWYYDSSLAAYYYNAGTDANPEYRYLVYDESDSSHVSGWALRMKPTYTVTYNGINLGATSTTITTSATKWYFSTQASGDNKPSGTMSTLINGVRYYVGVSGGKPIVTNAAGAISWSYSTDHNAYYYSDGTNTLYLIYDEYWRLSLLPAKYIICEGSDGQTYYLGTDGTATGFNAGKTGWQVDTTNGLLYTYIDGSIMYLNGTGGTLKLTSSKPSVSWSAIVYDGSHAAFCVSYNSEYYYLTYVDSKQSWVNGTSGWQLIPLRYLISGKSNNTTYYLPKGISTGEYESNKITGTTDILSAARWKISNYGANPDGDISTTDSSNGNTIYLYRYLAETRWFHGYYYLKVQSSSGYYEWDTVTKNSKAYLGIVPEVGDEYRYLSLSGSNWDLTESYSTVLTFTPSVNAGNNIDYDEHSTSLSATTDNLAKTVASSKAAAISTAVVYSLTAKAYSVDYAVFTDAVSESDWQNKICGLQNYTEITAKLTQRDSSFPASFEKGTTTALPVTFGYVTKAEPIETVSEKTTAQPIRTVKTTGQSVSDPTTATGQKSGYATYIPLRLDVQDESDKTSYYSDYRVSSKNTGYIVSGSNQTSGSYRSDIRVSNYGTSDIYRALNSNSSRDVNYSSSYDSKLQVVTKTYKTKELYGDYQFVRIQDSHNKNNMSSYNSGLPSSYDTWQNLGLTKYESEKTDVSLTRDAFADMLMGGSDVYGLHFMESTIPNIYEGSTAAEEEEARKHIVFADQTTILGNTYTNYELPEDCIDFYVNERGAINFFAGTYYSYDVTSFFSLHHIERDSNKKIETIKEIKKIYQRNSKSYIYKYGDGTYSDSSVTDDNVSKYTMVFDMEWITNPGTLIQNALYYFEIPVNRGEYALGSVEKGYGAYLLYLDIATNGGGVIEDRISSEGAGISNGLMTDYRSNNQVKIEDEPSLLQFSITCPESNSSSFSVNTTYFDKNSDTEAAAAVGVVIDDEGVVAGDEHLTGAYVLTINNKTNEDLELTVFVVDNDNDTSNEYPYAYKIRYTNNTYSEPQTLTVEDNSYFKSCYEYVIPSEGEVTQ